MRKENSSKPNISVQAMLQEHWRTVKQGSANSVAQDSSKSKQDQLLGQ